MQPKINILKKKFFSLLRNTMSTEKDKSQTGIKYLQKTYKLLLHKIYKTLLKLSNKKIKNKKLKDLNRHFTYDDKQIANIRKKRCSKSLILK